jgi:hypothetical protein
VAHPAGAAAALTAAAREVPPGPRFGVDGTLERFVRIPYTLPEEQLAEAVVLQARAWHAVTGATAPESHAIVV